MPPASRKSSADIVPPPPLPERNVVKENPVTDSILGGHGNGSVGNSRRPSSLQQLQSLDLFKYYSDDGDSFLLETEQYVKNMEKRRDRLLAQIDQQQQNYHLKKVGYEIERRVVRALQHRSMKKKGKIKKLRPSPFTTLSADRHRRLKRKHEHKICWKCVTSSFKSLFESLFVKCYYCSDSMPLKSELHHNCSLGRLKRRADETRTPTPKMLLMADGRIRWPVYQYGGTSESGMLISTNKLLVPPPSSIDEEEGDKLTSLNNNYKSKINPGRENFSLTMNNKTDKIPEERRSNKLLGWLQVRNSKGGKSSVFSQIVAPTPEGPFRKVPWQHGNGNLHVFKF